MSTVFISYRRQTAAGEARALFNDLVARLGESAVFMDVDSISLGRDFRSELQKTLAACDLMLVIIDKDWAAVKDERGRTRLEDAGDFVRMEIEAGLKRNIAVTPVLVKGAQMPAPEALPAEIRDLAYRNGFELSHSRWESDVREMIRRLSLEEAGGGSVPAGVKLRVDRDGPRHAAEGDRRRQAPPTARRKSLVIAGVLGVVCLGGVAAWLSIPKPEPSTPAQILPAKDDRQTVGSPTGTPPVLVSSPPSWCDGARKAAERAVCDTSMLLLLDAELNEKYLAATKRAGLDPEKLSALTSTEAMWLQKQRDVCGSDVTCLEGAYRSRIAALSSRPPSWCNGARKAAERAVCDTSTLLLLDAELNEKYLAATKRAGSDPEKLSALTSAEATWLQKQRDVCGSDVTCLEGAYRSRIAALSMFK